MGSELPTRKYIDVYTLNLSIGYQIIGGTDDEDDFEKYFPTIQKMINSFQIQGAIGNPTNTSLVPEIKTEPTADVVLLSQRLKIGTGGNNDIVGEVKNLGNDTAKRVRIDLTTYDNNGDVIGTDFTYSTVDTLKAGQKSSFDLLSSKDNFNDMKNYELSLQWRNPGGTDEYVENAQAKKDSK